jgi:nicotinate-nucleotide pyrophosphorylase (carboxylating)
MNLSPPEDLLQVVAFALAEDLGGGDVSALLIPPETQGEALVISRESAVICGIPWFDEVFRQLGEVHVTWRIEEGQTVAPDQTLCYLRGPARQLLSGERSALNFLQTLSGTATRVREYVDRIAGTGVRLLDTRKTLPGLRSAQKYAVLCGGGNNHRMGLYDAFLIKENHLMAAGSISLAVQRARALAPELLLEVEVENLAQLREALAAGVDRVLLDNFDPMMLREAVMINQGQAELEASGGITLENLRPVAETGVDFISLGTLTKDLRAVDLSMRFVA